MANGNNLTVWQNSVTYYFDPTTPIPASMATGYICIASGAGFQAGTYVITSYQAAYSAAGTNANGQNIVSLARAKADGTQYTTGQINPVSSVAVPPQSGAVWGWGATVAAAQTAAGYTPPPPATTWTEPAPNTAITGIGVMVFDGDSRVQYQGTRLQAELQSLFPNAGITANNTGSPGNVAADFAPGTARFTGIVNYLNSNASKVYFLSMGVNDSKDAVATTATAYQSQTQAIVDALFSQVATLLHVVLAEPFYTVPGSVSNVFTAASNTLQTAYIAALKNITRATYVPGLDTFFRAYPELLVDGVHPTPGDMAGGGVATATDGQHYEVSNWATAIANAISPPASNPPTTDPYRSDNATPVTILSDYKPGAPNPFAGTGLGTFLLPTVVLTWINPANLLGGTIHIMRMNAGTSDPFVVVGTVAGADANTAPAQTYTDTTHPCP